MFKKLKEKITEEVKSSPQRFQQLTQSVSDRLQNSATSDENFFSITEDDATPSNSSFESGFTNVSLTSPQEPKMRRNSNSSIASDVSFLPRYESFTNMYHLQSDLDISASEIEDNASNSSQLGYLSKEQIYSAFQKAQMRYHKYRGRYTDLAKHYKDLERDNTKIKSVLVETQDKAIRRVTELKEQCALEQKAKAHLESALRDELDEKGLKIQSLQTKIELLQNGHDGDTLDTLNKYLTDARQEIENLNQKIQEMKANSIIFQTKEQEYKSKIANLEKEISLFAEREKENNLSLAQNKMELHNELLSKDAEISRLKNNLEAVTGGKYENLQSQNTKLIEKVENLTQKCNNYENELLKMEQFKEENSRLKKELQEAENQLETVREDAKKSLFDLQTKIREKFSEEFKVKEEQMRDDLRKKFEEASSSTNNLQEMQLSLVGKDEEIEQLRQVNEEILEELTTKTTNYADLERNHLQLIKENGILCTKTENLEKELETLQSTNQATILKLEKSETNLKTLEETFKLLEKERNALLEEKRNFMENLEEERRINEQFNLEVEEFRTKMKKFESLVKEKNTVMKALEDEKRKCLELEETKKEFESNIADLKKNLEEIKLSVGVEEETEKKLEEFKSRVRTLEENKAEILKEKNILVESLEEEKRKCLELEETKKEFQITISDLKKNLEESRNNEMLSLEVGEEAKKNLEQLKSRVHELEENEAETAKKFEDLAKENTTLTATLEERREHEEELVKERNTVLTTKIDLEKNLKEERRITQKLNSELEHLKTIVEEKKKDLEVKLDEERSKLLQKLEESANTVKHLEETSLSLTEELKELKTKNEEIAILKTECDKLKDERDYLLKKLAASEENNTLQIMKIQNLEKEMRSLYTSLENERKNNSILQTKEEHESVLKQQLEEKEESLRQLKILLEEKENIYTRQMDEKESDVKNLEEVIEKLKKNESEEKSHLLEEITLLKKLLEEANNNLTIKEHEVKKIESYETDLKNKNIQIETLLKKIEEYNDLIEERNEGFFKILPEPLNNIRRKKDNKNLLNLEQKLQNFEQTFSLEKENLAKILIYLKQFEEKNSIISGEKTRLEEEKEELLVQINELRQQITEVNSARSCVKQAEEEILRLKEENVRIMEEQEKMKQNLLEVESRNTQVVSDSNFLSEENQSLLTEIEELKLKNEEYVTKYKNLEAASNQNQLVELERQLNELQHEKQLLLEEIEELKTTPINLNNKSLEEDYLREIETLRTKIVQYKSLDLTNRNSIEFYENELQKLKNQNEKLNRKLDETLVTLNHCSELSNSTEIEYLRNVLYNYMLGKESVVLARVIAAVCKFDPQQTEIILAKEQQKQTLLGQLGIL